MLWPLTMAMSPWRAHGGRQLSCQDPASLYNYQGAVGGLDEESRWWTGHQCPCLTNLLKFPVMGIGTASDEWILSSTAVAMSLRFGLWP